LDMTTVVRLYESSRSQFKPKLLLIFNDEYGQFNTEEGIEWLYSNANGELSKAHVSGIGKGTKIGIGGSFVNQDRA